MIASEGSTIRLLWFWPTIVVVIVLTMLAPFVLGINSGLTPESPWSGREAVPVWLRIWMYGILLAFIASLFFLRRSVEARAAVVGFVLSHLPMVFPLFHVTVGVVGLMHVVCWSPALVLLARRRPTVDPQTPFGVWVHAMIFFLAVSLAFDLRDALRYFVLG